MTGKTAGNPLPIDIKENKMESNYSTTTTSLYKKGKRVM
jgi:hypothetical protein